MNDPTQSPERRRLHPKHGYGADPQIPMTSGSVHIDVRVRDPRLRAGARLLIISAGRVADADRVYRAHYQVEDGEAEQQTVSFQCPSSHTAAILAAAFAAVLITFVNGCHAVPRFLGIIVWYRW